jgi:hypothetical protein
VWIYDNRSEVLPRPEAAGRIEMQAMFMYSVVYLEMFAMTETAWYSA